jgi:tryptophanyl-tRNA synthetase
MMTTRAPRSLPLARSLARGCSGLYPYGFLQDPEEEFEKDAALASLDGKKKMSTMEKSRHDWGQYKSKADEKTRDDMEKFAKDGYLAKQDFLARSDVRQAEVSRSNRRRGMGLKD